jgi:hypothetical protein
MNKQNVRVYRSETLSLLTLKIVLTNARKGVPPNISKRDRHEELASHLIKKMRRPHKKLLSFMG